MLDEHSVLIFYTSPLFSLVPQKKKNERKQHRNKFLADINKALEEGERWGGWRGFEGERGKQCAVCSQEREEKRGMCKSLVKSWGKREQQPGREKVLPEGISGSKLRKKWKIAVCCKQRAKCTVSWASIGFEIMRGSAGVWGMRTIKSWKWMYYGNFKWVQFRKINL